MQGLEDQGGQPGGGGSGAGHPRKGVNTHTAGARRPRGGREEGGALEREEERQAQRDESRGQV